MKLLFDFFPIVLFFIGYKLFGIYTATLIAIIASFVQVIFYRLVYHRFEKMQIISLAIVTVLGGATLFFHDPVFIKWKPTGIYWLAALLFVLSPLLIKRPLIQKIMEKNIQLPTKIWYRLNYLWALFFIIMGSANVYVAYYYSLDAWVNFKLFGCLGLTLLFVFLQAFYLAKHIKHHEETQATPSPKVPPSGSPYQQNK